MEDQFSILMKTIDTEINAHERAMNRWMLEALVWRITIALMAACSALFGVLADIIHATGWGLSTKIWLSCIVPLVVALNVIRAPDLGADVHRRLASEKRHIFNIINDELLKEKELRESPSDFYRMVTDLLELLNRNVYIH